MSRRGWSAVVAAGLGALFAIGLAIGGMTSPAKVVGFLDVTGGWDPQLAFVMGGAVVVFALGRRLAPRAPVLAPRFYHPEPTRIDAPLIAGSAIFGVGWGLSGYCPGPALVSVSAAPVMVFVVGMIGGIALVRVLLRR